MPAIGADGGGYRVDPLSISMCGTRFFTVADETAPVAAGFDATAAVPADAWGPTQGAAAYEGVLLRAQQNLVGYGETLASAAAALYDTANNYDLAEQRNQMGEG